MSTKPNLVILGMHRSGTSMVAGALVRAGLYPGNADELLVDQEDNPHGFWERRDVVALNDEILASAGGVWFDPPSLALDVDVPRLPIEEIVARLGSSPWLIKDPRMVITWPCWRERLGEVVVLYVYRNPAAVALSLQRRNQFPLSLGLALWEYYNRAAIEALAQQDSVAVSFDAISAEPVQAIESLLERLAALGLGVTSGDLNGVYDKQLSQSWREHAQDVEQLMTADQCALADYCEAMCAGKPLPKLPPADRFLQQRIHDLATALEPLSDARETRTRLEERTDERDALLAQLKSVEAEYSALHKAHEQEKARHAELARTRDQLESEHLALAEAHRSEVSRHEQLVTEHNRLGEEYRALLEKAEFLFELVTRTFHNLLAYETSFLGSLGRWTRLGYRFVTFQRGKSTSYEDALAEARHHFAEFEMDVPKRPPGKLALAGDVFRYVVDNPAGSARSFSLARLKRASSVFLTSRPEDLKVWIDSRFPDREDAGLAFDAGSLDDALDHLELTFPVFDSPRVSIIVPVYNEYRVTISCLAKLLEHTSDIPYEVIIADDCSSDLTDSISDRVRNVRVVRGEQNRGFLRNCNAAAAQASGEHVLLLNNDTAPCEGWLAPMLAIMDERPTAGIVGPKLLFADGRLQEAGGIMWRDGSAWNFGRADDPEKPEYNYLKSVDYISGACLLIRKTLWDDIGGFDERYVPAYYEDADIAFEARSRGYEVIYQPLSRVFHFEGLSNGTDLEAGIKQHQVSNQTVFRDKWQQTLDAFHFPNAENVFQARDRSRNQRSILFIDHYVPHHDKDAGSRSTLHYVKLMLAMGYKVLFMGANFFPHKPYTEQLQQLGVEVLVGEYMARNLDKWLGENAPYIDTIYLHRPHVAEQFLASLHRMKPRPKIIFFGHDLHYLRVAREAELLGDATLEKTSESWRKREYAVFDKVDTVYYPSQVEVDAINASRADLDVRAIPLYTLDIGELPPYEHEGRADILFVGGFNHPPNVDAVCWFVDQVLPLVRAGQPEVRLHVVGSNPTDAVQELQSDAVQVYGYLSDAELEAMYRRIMVAVVPLRYGAGVKGKVIEAIQMNVPLVTTAVGAEGIPEAERVMSVADTAEELAQSISRVVTGDPASLAKLANYRNWLEDHFSTSKASQIVVEDFGPPRREVAIPVPESMGAIS